MDYQGIWRHLRIKHKRYCNSVIRKYCACRRGSPLRWYYYPSCLCNVDTFLLDGHSSANSPESRNTWNEKWNDFFKVFVEQAKVDHPEWVMESYLI